MSDSRLVQRVARLEEQVKGLKPELHFPSAATLEHRLRWLEIAVDELRNGHRLKAELLDEEGLRNLLGRTTYIKPDRLTLHSLTADPASCAAGDVWYRSDLDQAKLAIDATPGNAKLFPAAAGIWEHIATTTLTGSAASVSFSNLSTAYTYFRLAVFVMFDATSTKLAVKFNDTGTWRFEYHYFVENTEYSSYTGTDVARGNLAHLQYYDADTGCPVLCYIQNLDEAVYRGAHSTFGYYRAVGTFGSTWNSTAKVTKITLYPESGSFLAGSKFILEGCKE